MVATSRPTEGIGYVSRFFQNRLRESALPTDYSHVILLWSDGEDWYCVENALDGAEFTVSHSLEEVTEFCDILSKDYDFWVFNNDNLDASQLYDNSCTVVNSTAGCSYYDLFRALIQFSFEGHVCTTFVLAVLGIQVDWYPTVSECLQVISEYYPLEAAFIS